MTNDTASRPDAALRRLARRVDWWYLVVLLGLWAIVVGMAVLVYPDRTLLLVSICTGVYLVALAIIGLAQAFTSDQFGGVDRVLGVLLWLLAPAAAIFVLARPIAGLVVIVIGLGTYLLASAARLLFTAWRSETARRWNLARGLLDLGAGGVVVAWPGIGLTTLVLVVGIYLLLFGATQVALGLDMRTVAKTLP